MPRLLIRPPWPPGLPTSRHRQDIGRIYKRIVADLKLKETGVFKSEVGSIHPENYLRRFMSMLGMANADMNAAIALANAALPQVRGPPGSGAAGAGSLRSPAAGCRGQAT